MDANIKRLRVVKVIEEGRVGGPQMDIVRTSKELRARGVDVVVVVPHIDSAQFCELLDSFGIPIYGVTLTRPGAKIGQLIQYFARFIVEVNALAKVFRKLDPDLVHAGGGAWQIKGVLAARVCQIPVIWHLNDTGTPWPVRALFKSLKRIPVGFICAGKSVKKYYFGKSAQSNIIVIQSPVDCEKFCPTNREILSIERSRQETKIPLILTVGNLGRVKGVEVFISAISRVVDQREIRAQVIGKKLASQKGYINRIDSLIEKYRLGNVVNIVSSSDIATNLQQATVYVCASWSEASPTAVWEAMSMGVPVVATDVGDVNRFIKDGETGYVVERGSDHMIAERIMTILENPSHAREMGARARAVALLNFDQAKVAELHQAFYRQVLAKSTPE